MYRLLKHPSRSPASLKDKAGVYMLECSSCEKFYIGQTGRSFGTRFKEHLPKGKLTNITSNFAKHLVDTNHDYVGFESNCTPLHLCEKGPWMNTLEEFEIYKAYKHSSDNILNDKLCFTINTLYDLAMEEEARLSHKRKTHAAHA